MTNCRERKINKIKDLILLKDLMFNSIKLDTVPSKFVTFE